MDICRSIVGIILVVTNDEFVVTEKQFCELAAAMYTRCKEQRVNETYRIDRNSYGWTYNPCGMHKITDNKYNNFVYDL